MQARLGHSGCYFDKKENKHAKKKKLPTCYDLYSNYMIQVQEQTHIMLESAFLCYNVTRTRLASSEMRIRLSSQVEQENIIMIDQQKVDR